ncbi:MAG: DNA alkylation repair protein [Phycisphaerae bacterium]|nr:DNA alkylation repair protein [Gemmatimonadaceae bacterium]
MAEPLKNQFGADIPRRIAAQIATVTKQFDHAAFLRDTLDGYDELELMPRARRIARTLRAHLPAHYPDALKILMDSIGPRVKRGDAEGMAAFYYAPHTCFVSEFGLDDFEVSMRAQYELTQRFTAEFSIRPFLERHQEATLAQLRQWATDSNVHVRRLVSEGSRPRLPWASRLRAFQKDPTPVLGLLELLKDDPELYVRRSVANNLNDIGKDHPDILVGVAKRWLERATDERRWIINHALRSAIKRTESGALETLGFGKEANVTVRNCSVTPERPHIGGSVVIRLDVANKETVVQRVLVDLRVHFVKANGQSSAKTFKLKTLELAARQTVALQKTISLAQLTTRKHYPGTHVAEVLLNGKARRLGVFDVTKARPARS